MTEIHLTEEEQAFIDAKLRSGVYRSAEDVVRAGLQLLDRDDEHVRQAIDAADAQVAAGDTLPFENADAIADSVIERGMRRLNRKS
ncbi:putative addiction module antidote protein, CC2985 family [Rhizobium sp. RU35A]|uniref:Type II toxin-antitoxin system ParD family antitoxin n=1 Tax=Rhizobium straminoryzae TaxID=1387186 RepID=A0A549T9S8_9HYPH|nr:MULTISPECIES: type II toxin-antitoxin system ParD family antitoxin [Rhizobium]TRL38622.1 type II toxin-antitoxin system ParD family antitoxin [Rhizobium straminoryzae]SIP92418.1 putative addiction module antidote protein, CC2985 family [Rhizobium sp. RU35A]